MENVFFWLVVILFIMGTALSIHRTTEVVTTVHERRVTNEEVERLKELYREETKLYREMKSGIRPAGTQNI